jgi:hypothetical protein
MNYTILIILKAQIVVVGIIALSSFIELITDLKLIIWAFRWKKNIKMANGAANIYSLFYFLICLGTMFYDRNIADNHENYDFWIWLLITIMLTLIVRKLYFKTTTKDPNRNDFDFSN